jgi:Flp pilus assembly protein TadD
VKALADLDQALALAGHRHDLHHRRAGVLASLDEPERAVESLARAVALAPCEPKYHAWRGYYRALAEGPSSEAEADVLRAVELAPEDVTALLVHAAYLVLRCDPSGRSRVFPLHVPCQPTGGAATASRSVGTSTR